MGSLPIAHEPVAGAHPERSPLAQIVLLSWRAKQSTTLRRTAADIITVTYVEPEGSPPIVPRPLAGRPVRHRRPQLQSVANSVMEVLAEAVGKLATIGDGER